MRVAFHAPLKSPDHPVPSGDREVARQLQQALRLGGHEVTLPSRFRSFDRSGDVARQQRLAALGTRIADRLVARYRVMRARPELWFTYHVHHKAPDFLGPRVSGALAIPYVVAEASIAPKQRHGPWAIGYAHALEAIAAADAVVFLNPVDVAQVTQVRGEHARAETLPPFLDVTAFAGADPFDRSRGVRHGPVRLVTVAMMRDGAKLLSYRVLAQALARLLDLNWELVVAGDGPARPRVEAELAALGSARVRFAGMRSRGELAALLKAADVFVWPAIDEAFGMAFLEAQACGLPVVGGASGGVAAVVADGRSGWLAPAGDAQAFAEYARRLVVDTQLRASMGREAVAYVRARHDLPAAAQTLDRLLRELAAGHGAHRAAASAASPR